jgi:hypothetical protein
MAGFTSQNSEHLIRSNLWSAEIKTVLLDELQGTKYVRMLTDFPDGDQLNIPSIGQAEVFDYVEGNPVEYSALDTGNFTFTINKYKTSATWITDKMKQDSFYMNQLVSQFLPSQSRALAVAMETDILDAGVNGQTSGNSNAINGVSHRWVGSGTSNVIDVVDFENARYALQKARVPMVNLVAIVDPSVEYQISTQSQIVNLLTPNQKWASIVNDGSLSGMQFKYNIYGFDVYVSNYLQNGIGETVNGKAVTNGVANLFFSAAPEILPIVGLIRQPPKVDSEYNKDFFREEYVTSARWGFKLFRPENLAVVLTDASQVSF